MIRSLCRGATGKDFFPLLFDLELSLEISPEVTFKMHVIGSSSSSEASEESGGKPNGYGNVNEISQWGK